MDKVCIVIEQNQYPVNVTKHKISELLKKYNFLDFIYIFAKKMSVFSDIWTHCTYTSLYMCS